MDTISEHKALVLILDGFGYDARLEAEILRDSFNTLQESSRSALAHVADQVTTRTGIAVDGFTVFATALNRNPLTRSSGTTLDTGPLPGSAHAEVAICFDEACVQRVVDRSELERAVRVEAERRRYAVWAARTPCIDKYRLENPSVSTKATGIHAGFEDLRPEVQGNSETGHQQLGNLTVAPQIPLQVAIDISDGSFVRNEVLNAAVDEAVRKNVNLNITFLISGDDGKDGRVHSCWNHCEAFLELLFQVRQFPPARVRFQAILDGRDAPATSSVQRDGGRPGFIPLLRELLRRYNAEESIAWIVGRGIAMDRDFEEDRTKQDYRLLVEGSGLVLDSVDAAVRHIQAEHERGVFDAFMAPIVVRGTGGEIRCVGDSDVVVNLNFRADRQRARMACLLGATGYIEAEAAKKGKLWAFDWLKPTFHPSVYCLTEYHPVLAEYGANIVYRVLPQPHNYLALATRVMREEGQPWKYLLVAESTKAVHVGYFIRGRREAAENPESEARFIVNSFADERGIHTDDDYYKTPQMRAFEIAARLASEMWFTEYNLAIANISNPDMLGHLIGAHFPECVQTLEAVDRAVDFIVPFALARGFDVVLTADHGNIDEDGASHSLNPVITTFVAEGRTVELLPGHREPIYLFDIPWAIATLLGHDDLLARHMPPVPKWMLDQDLVGKSPIRVR